MCCTPFKRTICRSVRIWQHSKWSSGSCFNFISFHEPLNVNFHWSRVIFKLSTMVFSFKCMAILLAISYFLTTTSLLSACVHNWPKTPINQSINQSINHASTRHLLGAEFLSARVLSPSMHGTVCQVIRYCNNVTFSLNSKHWATSHA